MKITKYAHCCMLIVENNVRILTDPGVFGDIQHHVKDLDIILITHEHSDHLHVESLKRILTNNPTVRVITTETVGKILDAQDIKYEIVGDSQSRTVNGVLIEGFGTIHEEIHKEFAVFNNTGYFINNKLFYPGDAFTIPNKKVDVLALPVAGPWLNIKDAVNYAINISPRLAFPVHDSILVSYGGAHAVPSKVLPIHGIDFKVFELGVDYEV